MEFRKSLLNGGRLQVIYQEQSAFHSELNRLKIQFITTTSFNLTINAISLRVSSDSIKVLDALNLKMVKNIFPKKYPCLKNLKNVHLPIDCLSQLERESYRRVQLKNLAELYVVWILPVDGYKMD